MKRLYLVAAVASLCSVTQLRAQEGLAPTAPVVPAPVLQNGNLQTPSSGNGWGGGGSPRLLPTAKWSPFRNPATASAVEPTAPAYIPALPPLPAGLSGAEANCGPAGCAPGRDRSCWARVKAFLTYSPSPTDIPTCRPTPYVTPLIGMFPCTSSAGCGSIGYASEGIRYGVPSDRQPPPYVPPTMPQPQPVPTVTTAGAVVMPSRGMPGRPVQPTWQGRVVPESAVTAKPAPGTIVPTGFKYPVPVQK
jgi:hypothetical protein